MRLIDADRLLNHAIAFFTGCHTSILQFSYVSDMIINAPTVDAVPVVRCKECKHMRRDNVGVFCKVWHCYNGCGEDGFCCYGERRPDES